MWYKNSGNEKDTAVSTRVRLARNIKGYPFGSKLSAEDAAELTEKICSVFRGKEGWNILKLGEMSAESRLSLSEKHIISREFAEKNGDSTLISNEEKNVYIMLLEEDHVRIQAINAGLELDKTCEAVFEAEKILDSSVEIAYSEKYGYLTHCPTNLGTGMRASAMLHLPMYTRYGGIRDLALQLAKLGMTVRGMDGEGSEAKACLYQISNQVTLGISEEETVEKLKKVIAEISKNERGLREHADPSFAESIEETALRSYGILLYSPKISTSELYEMYSPMRLAAAMGKVKLDLSHLDELLFTAMPYSVSASGANGADERDRARANLARRLLKDEECNINRVGAE